MKRLILWSLLAAVTLIPVRAEHPTFEDVDIRQAAGNYYCYPYMTAAPPAATPAPEGYAPFHLEHYGRHGSRYLIGDRDYNIPVELLSKAERYGKLTPLGKRVLTHVKAAQEQARLRDGDLSDNGALQHRGIGRRMAESYPGIFRPGANVDAKATVVIRCILSMQNGVDGILSAAPDVKVHTDASRAEMYYMNFDDLEAWKIKDEGNATILKDFTARHPNNGRYLSLLINDERFASDSIGTELFEPLFYVLQNAQSHSNQQWLVEEIFTPEEAREAWLARNAGWFIHGGNSRLTNNRMPYTQVNLLENMIQSTDSTLNSATPSANLRYGHDGIVLPLITLMELDHYGEEINDLEELADKGWHDYLLVPMGANVQIIFYRRQPGENPDDVLVKVMLNEREAMLPLQAVEGPYYRYGDFRRYYLDKIAAFRSRKG